MSFADLNNKTALVTGGNRGIGKVIATTLRQAGAEVMITGSNEATLKEAALEVGAGFAQADLSSNEGAEALVRAALEKFPDGVDILVNNAGFSEDGLFVRQTPAQLEKVMQINFSSAVTLSRGLLQKMMKKRHGRIVNITSVVAHMGNSGQTAYVSSKAAMTGFTKALAKEVARRGITVNAVAPGFIETDMTAQLPEKVVTEYKASIPGGQFGTPQNVADAVRFLVSDEAAYMTGTTLHVNGGLYL